MIRPIDVIEVEPAYSIAPFVFLNKIMNYIGLNIYSRWAVRATKSWLGQNYIPVLVLHSSLISVMLEIAIIYDNSK